jgi:GntR family transcriptional regulator
MQQAGIEAGGRLTSLEQVGAGTDVASHLAIEEGELVVVRRGEMLAGGLVAQLYVATYPLSLVAGTELVVIHAFIPGGIYAALDRAGLSLESATDEIGARAPSPEEAAALRLSPGIPVLTIARTAYDASGRPVEYLETVNNAEMLLLVYKDLPLA